jgi:hypothetical protein
LWTGGKAEKIGTEAQNVIAQAILVALEELPFLSM